MSKGAETMRFVGLLVVLMLLTGIGAPLRAQQKAETEKANEHLREAVAHVKQERYKDALAALEKAAAADPNYALVQQWLGYTYAQLGEREKSIRAYARALQLEVRSASAKTKTAQEVKQSLVQLLNDGLPAWADTATLETLREHLYQKAWTRQELTVDVNAVVRPPLPDAQRLAFYTHGLLYAPSGTQDPSLKKSFNRVCVGYVLDPADSLWRMRFRVFYVSEALATRGQNYAPLAEQVCATLLQLYWLARQSLNATTRFSPEKPTDVWLCEGGTAGAEQPANAPAHLYFYDINNPQRTPLEWLREIAHEYGHLTLPGIDGFEGEVEPYVNGHAGERLFLLWWLAHALRDTPRTPDNVAAFKVSPQDLAAYVRDRSYPALRSFLNEGPRSPLIDDLRTAGMEFLVGFLIYVERTHDSLLTQAVLDDAKKQVAVFLKPRDVFNAYVRTLEKLGATGYSFYPTMPVPRYSRLSQPPTAERLAQNAPTLLRAGDEAAYWIYLPSSGKGKWKLEVTAHAPSPSVLAVNWTGDLNRSTAAVLEGSPAKATFNLAADLSGWQLVRVKLQSGA
ncbi:MAG: hypothetical protein NZT92_18220, partial [Abditibacteriales bacterium]|nr:hypothetical protein [Abditibacteriales bacterium]